MKYILSFTMVLFALSAHAASSKSEGQTLISDAELGEFIISVTDVGEPVYQPLLYTLSVHCRGDKQTRELKRVKICKFREHSFDQNSKALEVRYTIVDEDAVGDEICTHKKISRFNLKKECATKP